MTRFYAGAAQVDITPQLPATLGGFFLSFPCDRVLDKLYASAVSLSDGDQQVILVSCDLGYIMEETVAQIRDTVQEATGVQPANINISATHTHSGPYMGYDYRSYYRGEAQDAEDKTVRDRIAAGIAQAAIEAFERQKPASVGYGSASVGRCCYNRRFIMGDGRSRMQPGFDNPDSLMVEGPVDNQFQVVWFEDDENHPLAIMANLASHPVNFYGCAWLSADFPGEMRAVVNSASGKPVPVLFLQGACGNVTPINYGEGERWENNFDRYRRCGRILAGEVIRLMAEGSPVSNVRMAYAHQTVAIPYRAFSPDDAGRLLQLLADSDKADNRRAFLFSRLQTTDEKTEFHTFTGLHERKKRHPDYQIDIAALRLNDIVLVTNPAELFVEYQIEIKKALANRSVMVAELTNGWISYVPTLQAIALGGYEPTTRRTADDTGKIITERSIALILSLFPAGGADLDSV